MVRSITAFISPLHLVLFLTSRHHLTHTGIADAGVLGGAADVAAAVDTTAVAEVSGGNAVQQLKYPFFFTQSLCFYSTTVGELV